MRAHELEPYVKEFAKENGIFCLMEIPKSKVPSVNLFLERGVMTPEGEKKYQEAMSDFLKGNSNNVVATYKSNRTVVKLKEVITDIKDKETKQQGNKQIANSKRENERRKKTRTSFKK